MSQPPKTSDGRAYKAWLLGLLALISALNYKDRLIFGVVLQDIKLDLHLTDTEIGALSGIAFAVFYTLAGIPIARWADRGNRITIIAVSTALWSGALALCGLAGSFFQLFLVRIGVAVGEAGSTPPSHSLMADTFAREERPRATAIYMLGPSIAAVFGYFGAGWLNQLLGWRMTFVVLGVPGILVAAIAWLTLHEPRRKGGAAQRSPDGREESDEMPLLAAARTLLGEPTFRHLVIAFSLATFFSTGIAQWKPAFFIRSYGLGTGELGTWLTLIYGVGGLIGTWIGGVLAVRFAAGDEGKQLRAIAGAYAVFACISPFIYLVSDYRLAFAIMGATVFLSTMTVGPLFATIQTVVQPELRALSIAIIYLFANLVGMGLGPVAAGFVSDCLRPAFGQDSLRYALLVFSPGYLWSAWHLFRASQGVEEQVSMLARCPGPAPRDDAPIARKDSIQDLEDV